MRDAVFLMLADTAHLLRRREIWVWAFGLPLIFFYFIGTITARWSTGGNENNVLAVYVAAGAGPIADHLLAHLKTLDYSIARVPARPALTGYDRQLSIPADFSTDILAHKQTILIFKRHDSGLDAEHDTVRLDRAIFTVLGDLIVLDNANESPTVESLNALDRAPRLVRLVTKAAGHRKVAPSGFEQAVPGSMVFFILMVMLSYGAGSLVAEREQGILRRLACSPMSRASVVSGKWGARMSIGLIQIAFAMVTGTLLFHVRWGSYVWMVLLVLIAYAAFSTATGILLGTLARTKSQAGAFGALAANLLACIGGCWWPMEIMPRTMQTISQLTPPGMAMDALHQLVNFGSGPIAAVPGALALFALAGVASFFAARKFRFQ